MDEVFENITKLISKLDEVAAEYKDALAAGSQFENENSGYHDKKRIADAFAFGRFNLRAGREHLAALPTLFLNENILTGAVAARTVLEASASAIWFLSPSIDVKERVSRGVIQLCEGKHQVKQLGGDTTGVDDFFENRLPPILAGNNLEYRNSKGKLIKPHQVARETSKTIKEELGEEFRVAYRILSGIAHGQPVFLATFGYDYENAAALNFGLREIGFKPKLTIAFYALKMATESYAKAVETDFKISNWDFTKIEPAFVEVTEAILEASRTIGP